MAENLGALTVEDSRFLLREAPRCRYCQTLGTLRTVKESNSNGNSGRPYYICRECKKNQTKIGSEFEVGWITWNDFRGIDGANPRCGCDKVSRQDRAGFRSSRAGMGFWTCATGACDYYSEDRGGLTRGELSRAGRQCTEYQPWLL